MSLYELMFLLCSINAIVSAALGAAAWWYNSERLTFWQQTTLVAMLEFFLAGMIALVDTFV